MTVLTEIQNALEVKLNALSGTHDIAWQNINYEPAADTLFLRPTNIPVDPLPIGLQNSSSMLRNGIFQVDVFAPKNKGVKTALNKADSISAHFARGTELFTATDQFKIRILKVAVEVGDIVGSHYAVPVLIHYSALTTE